MPTIKVTIAALEALRAEYKRDRMRSQRAPSAVLSRIDLMISIFDELLEYREAEEMSASDEGNLAFEFANDVSADLTKRSPWDFNRSTQTSPGGEENRNV